MLRDLNISHTFQHTFVHIYTYVTSLVFTYIKGKSTILITLGTVFTAWPTNSPLTTNEGLAVTENSMCIKEALKKLRGLTWFITVYKMLRKMDGLQWVTTHDFIQKKSFSQVYWLENVSFFISLEPEHNYV